MSQRFATFTSTKTNNATNRNVIKAFKKSRIPNGPNTNDDKLLMPGIKKPITERCIRVSDLALKEP